MADNFYADYPVAGGGSGTVTSVGLADSTNTFNITNSPVTTSGTLTLASYKSQSANLFLASPSGSSGAPTFRAIVAADLPTGNLTDVGTDGITIGSGTGAVIGSGTTISQHVADASHNGYLSSTDWSTFNSKQSALTLGNLTDAGTDGITIGNGTGSVVGSGTTISQHVADTTHNGYLSSTDWNTFNGKQASGNYITALTGDGTASGPGSAALTLATVNSNVGSFAIATVTVNAKGLVTAASAASTTGSGNVVLATAPTMTNPVVGTQSQGDSSTKAASTSYVDVAVANAVAGVNPAVAVQAATTAAGDTSGFTYNNGASGIGAFFTGSVNTAITIDGYTFTAVGQRLLVKNDTQSPSGAFNGVYYVTQVQTGILAPILTRALDFDTPSDMNNTGAIPVINGTVNGTTSWVLTSLVVTVGTTPLTFAKFTRNPADYLLVANNLSDVANKATSFNNLSPMTTGGDIIYGGASGAGTRLANGSNGQVLTSSGGTSAPTWQTPSGGGGPPSKYCTMTYPASSTNYWQSENYTSAMADYSVIGTPPSPTTVTNVGFTTPTLPSGSYPGITFTAPSDGVIEVSFHAATSNGGSALCGVQLYESATSTVLDNGVIYPGGSIVQTPLKGFLSVTASTSYTVKLRANASTGNNWIYLQGLTPNDSTTSMLSISLNYVH